MERKDFLKYTLGAMGLTVIPIVFMESCTKKNDTAAPSNVNFTLDLTSPANSALNNVGGSLISNGVLVMRLATGFSALSSVCTHQGCTVGFSGAQVVCPCHNGVFNSSTGAVVSGPPPSALVKYTVTQSGNSITVKS